MKSFRNFFRHIRDGFRNLFRNHWMTLASIFTMTITLFMVGSLILVLSNVDNITKDIEEGVKIRVHIDIAADQEAEAKLKESIQAIDQVTDITYRTKEEELADLIQSVEEFELAFGDQNPLYNVFVVSVADSTYLDQVSQEIRALPSAVEVNYGEIDTKNLLKILDYIRIGFAFVAAIMMVIALAIISNTIKLTIYARQPEIEIMRLVGAHNHYIKAPFAYEGAFIGLIGGSIAALLLYGAYQGIHNNSVEFAGIKLLKLTPVWPIILIISGCLLVMGMIIGIIGANRSINKFIK